MSRQLPSQPHIDVLRKQAKALLSEHQSGQTDAIARVSAVAADLPASAAQAFSLRHAQQVLAREYGFSSWQSMADQVRAGVPEDWAVGRFAFYGKLTRDLADSHLAGNTSTFGVLGEQMARQMHSENDPLEAARNSISWLAGCQDWSELGRKASGAIEAGGVVREHLSTLERFHESLLPKVAARIGAPADIAFVDYTTVCEFVVSIGRPSHSFHCSFRGTDAPFVIDVGPRLVQNLGNDGSEVVEQLLGDLLGAWQPAIVDPRPSTRAFSDPFAFQAGRLYDTCVLIACEVTSDTGGLLSLCYPEAFIADWIEAQGT